MVPTQGGKELANLLQSTQQAKVGLNAEYTPGKQLQIEGSQDTIQATLRMSW